MSSSLLEMQRIHQSPSGYSTGTSSLVESEQSLSSEITGSVYTPRKLSLVPKDPLIEQYFREIPQNRLSLRRKVALRIKTFEAVFLVLEWSLRGDVDDAYDGAVDLLSECEGILIGALQYLYLEYPRMGMHQLSLETKLDVLINGLARAHRLSAESRLKAIVALMSCKSRIVKAAIIDAVARLENKRNKKWVKELLNWFASAKEPDAYLRQYAEDVLEDLA